MSKAWIKGSVKHYQKRADGKIGCNHCGEIATRWMNWNHLGSPRFVATAYCDDHGDHELRSPDTTQGRLRQPQ